MIWNLLTEDTDGDGTLDLFDNYKGFDDSTVVVVSVTNTTVMAKVGDNVYAAFNMSGDKISSYFEMSGALTSTGNAELGLNISPGGGFTFKGDDQIILNYATIPNPVGFP